VFTHFAQAAASRAKSVLPPSRGTGLSRLPLRQMDPASGLTPWPTNASRRLSRPGTHRRAPAPLPHGGGRAAPAARRVQALSPQGAPARPRDAAAPSQCRSLEPTGDGPAGARGPGDTSP